MRFDMLSCGSATSCHGEANGPLPDIFPTNANAASTTAEKNRDSAKRRSYSKLYKESIYIYSFFQYIQGGP